MSLQTPFKDGQSPPDTSGDGVTIRGGRPMPSRPGGAGLVSSPFNEAIVSPPGTDETPNSSSLPARADGHTPGAGDPGESGGVAWPALDEPNKGRTFGG